MKRHFHDELKALKQKLLSMSFLVESALEKAVEAFLGRNEKLILEIFDEEETINQFEIEIDDQGHALLAVGQPMAFDLRSLTAILKINTDLERLGDHAVNIAERARTLLREPPLPEDYDLPKMARATLHLFRQAIDSFMNDDADSARNVLLSDDEVDLYNDNLFKRITTAMQKDPSLVKTGVNLMMIGHNLERTADLATNIAEDVIYMKQGKEVRHRIET
ncbi:MAG: phosphate signaling complex protein PhoU [Candidatus Omnitrophica bacterium]|nr:phosphate signaling complex protein PhoU [Candidatus Omnitrophota bacterium]